MPPWRANHTNKKSVNTREKPCIPTPIKSFLLLFYSPISTTQGLQIFCPPIFGNMTRESGDGDTTDKQGITKTCPFTDSLACVDLQTLVWPFALPNIWRQCATHTNSNWLLAACLQIAVKLSFSFRNMTQYFQCYIVYLSSASPTTRYVGKCVEKLENVGENDQVP